MLVRIEITELVNYESRVLHLPYLLELGCQLEVF